MGSERSIKAEITQYGTSVKIRIQLDNIVLCADSMNFCDYEHAAGEFAKLFHTLTYNRYSHPVEAIPDVRRILSAPK